MLADVCSKLNFICGGSVCIATQSWSAWDLKCLPKSLAKGHTNALIVHQRGPTVVTQFVRPFDSDKTPGGKWPCIARHTCGYLMEKKWSQTMQLCMYVIIINIPSHSIPSHLDQRLKLIGLEIVVALSKAIFTLRCACIDHADCMLWCVHK